MGSVLDFVENLVCWVGDLISSIVIWFDGEVKNKVQKKTEGFLLENEGTIKSANDPKQMAKVAAEFKSLKQLEKIAEKEKKKLCPSDIAALNILFANDPDFF